MVIGLADESIRRREMSNEKKALSARLRTADFGSAGSRRLLRNGEIPAVVYGKSQPLHVIVNAHEFEMKKSGFSESTLITLNVEGESAHNVFVKSYQEDLLRRCIHHIDFFEVTAGHTVRTHVRVELEGNPVGCRQGGVLDQVIHELEIECLPKDLPEVIKADVSALALNEAFRVDQLQVPAGIKIHEDPEATIATVRMVKEEAAPPVAETEADATAAPADAATTETK